MPLQGTCLQLWEVTRDVALHPTSVFYSHPLQGNPPTCQPNSSWGLDTRQGGHHCFLLESTSEEGGIIPRRWAGFLAVSISDPQTREK